MVIIILSSELFVEISSIKASIISFRIVLRLILTIKILPIGKAIVLKGWEVKTIQIMMRNLKKVQKIMKITRKEKHIRMKKMIRKTTKLYKILITKGKKDWENKLRVDNKDPNMIEIMKNKEIIKGIRMKPGVQGTAIIIILHIPLNNRDKVTKNHEF